MSLQNPDFVKNALRPNPEDPRIIEVYTASGTWEPVPNARQISSFSVYQGAFDREAHTTVVWIETFSPAKSDAVVDPQVSADVLNGTAIPKEAAETAPVVIEVTPAPVTPAQPTHEQEPSA